MRLLYIVHQFMPELAGGTERVTLNLARAAQADGHNVEILTLSLGSAAWRPEGKGVFTAMVEGVPVTALSRTELEGTTNLGFGRDEAFAAAFVHFLDERPAFDVAHVTHSFRTLEAVETLAARRVPYVMTLTDFFSVCHRVNLVQVDGQLCPGPAGGAACHEHCTIPDMAQEAYGRRVRRLEEALARASALVAVSPYVAARIRAEHPHLRVLVLGNGVDLLAFRPAPPRPADRPLTFGYLGTVSEAKGAQMLVRAFVRAQPANSRLRLVGPCYDEILAEELQAETARAAITLEGPVESQAVAALMSEFDILCVTSQVPEAFSLSLHEGFAAGLPALVSDLGNLGAVIRDAGCGRAVAAGDEAAWAQAIGEIAASPEVIQGWKTTLPLPLRIEEEAGFYAQIYRGMTGLRRPVQA